MSEARKIKSRAGCQLCKRRKVKCDLTSPACQQCIRQKLQCPGYKKPLKWVDIPEGSSNASKTSPPKQNDRVSRSTCIVQPTDDARALISHYFTTVCKIAGCFDSDLNPFRILASSMMAYSKPIYLLLQASSAAHISHQDPGMRIKAISLQSEAFSAVRSDLSKLQDPTQNIVSDELMLTSIMAGLTSAWYDVNDLGQSHVLGGQVLLYLWLSPQKKRLEYQQTFILGCFVYWFMISSFVVGDPSDSLRFQEALGETVQSLEMGRDVVDDRHVAKEQRRVIPHPLTGFSMELLISVGKVGSLCRISHGVLEDKARNIEMELFAHHQTHQSQYTDPGDPQTSIEEILSVGEAYRCAGLLQLYTKFPALLQPYVRYRADDFEVSFEGEMDAYRLNSTNQFTAAQHNWLRALAFHICGILDTIPRTSPTRVIQGLVVLIAATWLVDPVQDTANDAEQQAIFDHPELALRNSSTPKEYWREKISQGLRFHDEYVGLEQVSRVLNIVEEIWGLDDCGVGKCDWMDVVHKRGLQTLYG